MFYFSGNILYFSEKHELKNFSLQFFLGTSKISSFYSLSTRQRVAFNSVNQNLLPNDNLISYIYIKDCLAYQIVSIYYQLDKEQ